MRRIATLFTAIFMATTLIMPAYAQTEQLTAFDPAVVQSWGNGFRVTQPNPNDLGVYALIPEGSDWQTRTVDIPALASPFQLVVQDQPGKAPSVRTEPGRVEGFFWGLLITNPAVSDGAFLNPAQVKNWVKTGEGAVTRLPGMPDNQVYITWTGKSPLMVWVPDEFPSSLSYYVWDGNEFSFGNQPGNIAPVKAMILMGTKR